MDFFLFFRSKRFVHSGHFIFVILQICYRQNLEINE